MAQRVYGNAADKIQIFVAVGVKNVAALAPHHRNGQAVENIQAVFLAFGDYFCIIHN